MKRKAALIVATLTAVVAVLVGKTVIAHEHGQDWDEEHRLG